MQGDSYYPQSYYELRRYRMSLGLFLKALGWIPGWAGAVVVVAIVSLLARQAFTSEERLILCQVE